MNKLIELSREDIETKYLNMPIFIKSNTDNKWYLACDVDTYLPPHLVSSNEYDLYNKNKENFKGIEVIGTDCEKGYLLWLYFSQLDGWKAYGYYE